MKRFLVLLAMVGCGGQSVGIIGKGEVLMTPSEVDRLRTDLDFRSQALQGGSGYVVDCGTARDPYEGEATVYDQNWGGGQCNAIGADWAGGNGHIYFDLNEPIAKWGNGASMNNTLRSTQVRATGQAPLRGSFYRDFGAWGGGITFTVPLGQKWIFNVFRPVSVCAVPYDCDAPPEGTSFVGFAHN